mgnify:CR=1 FL=1
MKLVIQSFQSKHEYTVDWIQLVTPQGTRTIFSEHEPTLMTLVPHQEYRYQISAGAMVAAYTTQGIVEITRDTVTMLLQE